MGLCQAEEQRISRDTGPEREGEGAEKGGRVGEQRDRDGETPEVRSGNY